MCNSLCFSFVQNNFFSQNQVSIHSVIQVNSSSSLTNEKKNTLALLCSLQQQQQQKCCCVWIIFCRFFFVWFFPFLLSLSSFFSLFSLTLPSFLDYNSIVSYKQKTSFLHKNTKSSWWKHTWSAPRSSYGSAWRRTTRTSARPWTERACPRRKATWPRSTDLAAQVKLNSTTS